MKFPHLKTIGSTKFPAGSTRELYRYAGHTEARGRMKHPMKDELMRHTFCHHTITKAIVFALLAALTSPANVSASLITLIDFEGNTNDQSGENQVITGPGVTAYVAGFEGQAGFFDGIDDFVDIQLDISPGTMPNLTFGAWVNASTATGRRAILSADDNSPANYDRQIGIDDRPSSTPRYSAFAGQSTTVLQSSTPIVPTFTFVAARYDGSDVTLFVDGNAYTATDDTDSDATHEPFVRVGKNPNFDSFFHGGIDNVFIFDEALSNAQLDDIRINGTSAILAVPEPGFPITILLALPVAVWVGRRKQHRA